MKHIDDHVYITRIKNGDAASFSVLVNRYKDMAFTIALRILKTSEEAEDAAQESFIKAFQQLTSFQGNSKFSTWLYTIVYRTSLTRFQKNRLTTLPLDEDLNEDFVYDYSPTQLELLQLNEQSMFIRQAIQKLPQSEALLVTLFYLNENTIREIEEITGFTSSNIKVKLFRARKALEKELHFLIH